jgi:hypothetical protein
MGVALIHCQSAMALVCVTNGLTQILEWHSAGHQTFATLSSYCEPLFTTSDKGDIPKPAASATYRQ